MVREKQRPSSESNEKNITTNRRGILQYLGTGALASSLAGCSGGNTQQAGGRNGTGGSGNQSESLTITQGQLLQGLDPHDHVSTPDGNILMQAYENLVFRNQQGKIVPELATEWKRIQDGRMRFQIRDNVKFHNGDPLTPEDVAFSINRITQNSVGLTSPQQSTLEPITGAEVVDGERAVDVVSDGYNPVVLNLLSSFFGQVMSKSWIQERSKAEINKNINGTGPFKLDSYTQDVNVVYSRYDDYWKGPAAISDVTFAAASESSTRVNQLLERETDIAVGVPPQAVPRLESSQNATVKPSRSTRVIFAAMRYDIEPFTSKKFRQAMNYAIDIKSVVESILSEFANPLGQPTIPEAFGHNPNVSPYPYDPDKARRLVEQSGFSGTEITLHIPVGRYLKALGVAQAVANQIGKLPNVSCSVKQRQFSPLVEEVASGDITTSPPFYLIGWANEMFDASVAIEPVLTSDGVSTSYKNSQIDNLMQKAANEQNRQRRKRYYQKANKILHDRAPWLYLYQQYSIYGANSDLTWDPRADEFMNVYGMTRRNDSTVSAIQDDV